MQLSYDLPKNLFEIYSSYEEYNGKLDRYSRFLHQFSKNKDILNPMVSEYLINNNLLDIDWPEHRQFAACLTHDIDTVHPSLKYSLYTAMKFSSKLKFREAWQRIVSRKQRSDSKNPYWNFKEIINLERKYDAKSSFYFKATSMDPVGWVYDINELKEEMGYLVDNGWEVGLHGGFYSYNNIIGLQKEKANLESALGKKVVGIRMHFLRFNVPDTWTLLRESGFKYDTTFGYSDMPGFRNGMCHPFKPYDLNVNKEIDILEIPLTVMDSSLFNMNITEAWAIIKNLIERTEKNKGVITILWHNNTFDEIFSGDWGQLYEKILLTLKDKNAWMPTAKDIYNHWENNKFPSCK